MGRQNYGSPMECLGMARLPGLTTRNMNRRDDQSPRSASTYKRKGRRIPFDLFTAASTGGGIPASGETGRTSNSLQGQVLHLPRPVGGGLQHQTPTTKTKLNGLAQV